MVEGFTLVRWINRVTIIMSIVHDLVACSNVVESDIIVQLSSWKRPVWAQGDKLNYCFIINFHAEYFFQYPAHSLLKVFEPIANLSNTGATLVAMYSWHAVPTATAFFIVIALLPSLKN